MGRETEEAAGGGAEEGQFYEDEGVTVQTENVILIADLRYIAIECPHCRTRVILDMKEKPKLADQYRFFAPKECPGCRTGYDSAIQPGIDALQEAYQALLPIADRISFRGDPK